MNMRLSPILSDSPTGTKAVVTIIAAVRDSSVGKLNKKTFKFDDIVNCLQCLAADALVDDGFNIEKVKVTWTPSECDSILSPEQVMLNYPELIPL